MNFLLLSAIAMIPLIISISIMVQSKSPLSRALALFLLMLTFWQLDISLLYSHQFFDLEIIDILFRIFRVGPIMIMPIMYFFCYYLVKETPNLIGFKKIFNYPVFLIVTSFSVFVYLINFTNIGVQEYSIMPDRMFAPTHLIPIYGPLNITFVVNILFVFIHTFFLFILSFKVKDRYYRTFYKKLVIGAVFVFINGVISGFGVLPLYFSSFNSILVAIVLFLGFFQMQAQRLNTANQNLARQSSLLEEIMNINPNFIMVLNRENKIVKMNDSMEFLLSPTRKGEILGQDFKLLQQQPYNLVIESGELQRINRNGEAVYIEWGSKVLRHLDKESYTLFFGMDYTNQKRSEQLLLSSEKSKVIGELAASIAHEIRNPLTTIRGFIQIMKEEKKERQHKEIILDEIDRIDGVLKEMLLLAKPEAQVQGEKKLTHIDIVKELNNLKLLYDAVALEQNKDLVLVNKLTYEPMAYFNPSHFKQVIINILKNSFEATSEKGSIKLTLDEYDGNIRIRITDNGKGISKARLSRIGEPYFTSKEKGTGIGLTICFKLINDYSGKMNVLSKVGWGTVTSIILISHTKQYKEET
ncbi:ATP-binding protein [Sutcliffiella rhizosphaerae]|uniref:histidine kinase n=1 Tax=Sutcliffiella rhizosphaerae TaxID=2880967 RepID=A0ABM8YKB0_9BACI|nr:ATP-binding protein [Sutcliffiella rhizosphaerae]CAG9620296.1 Adaptive-response sensory-kinase SasA [Sutcliffiella rhizosphaerae]